MPAIEPSLATAGIILFLIGLINGLFIPVGRSPRLSLSAHLTAVQSGTFLIAISAIWEHLRVPSSWTELTSQALWVSLYVLWSALFLAGLFGAGRGLPIAGGGIEAKVPLQFVVTSLLVFGILGTFAATIAIVFWMLV
jgi:(hydroxyamino)benzene mutase